NSEAGNEGMRQFYEYAGLNSREIELLQSASPKRDYYIVQRLGRRMISFRLGPVAMAFLDVSGQKDRVRSDALAEQFGEGRISEWMRERKVERGWIDYYEGGKNYAVEMAR